MSTIDELVDWLIDGAPGVSTPQGVVDHIGRSLRSSGIPVDRMAAFVSTLHPSIAARAFFWSGPAGPTRVAEAAHGLFEGTDFKTSPLYIVRETRAEFRRHLSPSAPEPHPILDELAQSGFTDYLVLPLLFTSGERHAISFATKAAAGFDDDALAALRRVLRPLARVAEILALRRTATTLLSTYVGRDSGARIFAGQIQKGHVEVLDAVIWFSDLRAFTELSSREPPRAVIDTLNRVFECQVPAIEKHGGEVLKFMGDGLLSIFALTAGADRGKVADEAIRAAEEALAGMLALAPLRIGVALHVGELAYGNIGGSNRLDFTAIGAAVNIAARLEGLTSKLGRSLVLSEDVARLTTRATDALGAFDLKGVPAPVRVFALRE